MHPVEHLLYYGCATLPPLVFCVHPMHFLYCKFHADIAPIGGHDGMDAPGGKGDFHWLHHTKFECNYGVPFPINLDLMFGTWAEYDVWKETGELTTSDKAKALMSAKTLELVCDGHVLDDDEPLLSLSGRGGLALRVVRALYSLNAYCASLHAQRTAAPETMNGFRAGSWPRFSNHCMECQQPLHWVSGDSSGGGRHRAGTFFCQGCMLTFHVDELND